ncbi:MAG: terminase large subunit, partial [Selenomonadaceae bacterium]|nr:terminase large subunit [Selenomonadaceae bacterium]
MCIYFVKFVYVYRSGTKILYGSNDYDQADLLYMATDAMREASPRLAKCTRRNQKGIFFGNIKQRSHVGKFTSQNKGSIRKMSAKTNAKEGRNIKVGVVDEVHELRDETFVMPIKQALSTQEEPIYLELTTEGFTDGGYLDERLKLASSILNDEVEKPNMLIFWY